MKSFIKPLIVVGFLLLIAIATVNTKFPNEIPPSEDNLEYVGATISNTDVIEQNIPSISGIAPVTEIINGPNSQVHSFWNAVPLADERFAPALTLKLEQHRLIAFDREALIGITAQDKVELYIPHVDMHREVWIERVARLKSGNLSITGSVDGKPDFPFVLTLGENSVYAAFGTEDGVYNVRGNETHAWMIPTAELKKLRDFKERDFRTPDIENKSDG
jgi:hypothetical protein